VSTKKSGIPRKAYSTGPDIAKKSVASVYRHLSNLKGQTTMEGWLSSGETVEPAMAFDVVKTKCLRKPSQSQSHSRPCDPSCSSTGDSSIAVTAPPVQVPTKRSVSIVEIDDTDDEEDVVEVEERGECMAAAISGLDDGISRESDVSEEL
jgi:hypothetical protein